MLRCSPPRSHPGPSQKTCPEVSEQIPRRRVSKSNKSLEAPHWLASKYPIAQVGISRVPGRRWRRWAPR
eukprot:1195915-Rhodomonas_salina.3